MDGEQHSANGPNIAPNSSLPSDVSEPVHTSTAEPATTGQLQQVQTQMTGFERATLRWTKAAVLISTLAVIFICAQWYEMHTASTDTHDLAVAAKEQATAAGKQAEQLTNLVTQATAQANAAKASADATKQVAERALAQTNATNNLAIQAKRSADANQAAILVARDNLELAKNALRIQERPWMAINQNITTFENGVLKGKTIIANVGKSPAFQVTYHTVWGLQQPHALGPKQPLLVIYQSKEMDSRAIVMPQHTVEGAELTYSPLVLELNRINQGFDTVYYFGEVTYHDVFTSEKPESNPHITHFCEFWDRKAKKFYECPTYNDAD